MISHKIMDENRKVCARLIATFLIYIYKLKLADVVIYYPSRSGFNEVAGWIHNSEGNESFG